MKRIEEIIGDKLMELAHYVLSQVVKPDITLEKVNQLDEEQIKKLKQDYGIEGIILDVDDTLRKKLNSIPKCNQEWLDIIKSQLKVIVVTNGIDQDVEDYFRDKGIDYIGFAHKPLKRNFIKACENMNLRPDQVLVIGDSLFDDIYGGKRNNMKTALVNDVEER